MADDFEKKTQDRLVRLEARANACETLLVQVMRELSPEQRRSVLIRTSAEIERQQAASEERGFKLAGKELGTASNRLLRHFRPASAAAPAPRDGARSAAANPSNAKTGAPDAA